MNQCEREADRQSGEADRRAFVRRAEMTTRNMNVITASQTNAAASE